jgi:hypothetical protein
MITEKAIQKAIRAGKSKWISDDGDRGAGRLAFHFRARDGGAVLAEWYAVSRRRAAQGGAHRERHPGGAYRGLRGRSAGNPPIAGLADGINGLTDSINVARNMEQ